LTSAKLSGRRSLAPYSLHQSPVHLSNEPERKREFL